MVVHRNAVRVLVAVIIVVTVLLATVNVASAQGVGVRQDGAGQYAQLTAEWWQWILQQPVTGNPNLDQTGADAAKGQVAGGVFFLAGSFGGSVTRTFSVPAGRALFLPLLNNLGVAYPAMPNPQPKPNMNQVPQLRTLYAAPMIDAATGLHVSLDGASLLDSAARVKSPVFHFTSPAEDSFFGPGTFAAVSDGYWLYLAPLKTGAHVLHFGGTSGDFVVDITDVITVK